jgi:hypothetical protein
MGGEYSMYGYNERFIQYFSQKTEGQRPLCIHRLDGRPLKMILTKYDVKVWIDLTGSR